MSEDDYNAETFGWDIGEPPEAQAGGTTSNVSQLVDELGQLGQTSKELYGQYKAIEEKKAEARAALAEALQVVGLRSAKTSAFTASIAVKPSIQIVHEQSVIDWLQETPDVETDQYIGLKKTEFKTLATAMLKNTGEVIPGTEVLQQETLSVRANKKG